LGWFGSPLTSVSHAAFFADIFAPYIRYYQYRTNLASAVTAITNLANEQVTRAISKGGLFL
jgi:hypothetical protein